jgi:hypothetical protein
MTQSAHMLPRSFRKIRLELAREKGHPAGSAGRGYIIVAPLDQDRRFDAATWKEHRDACRVVRFRSGEDDDIGHLVHRPGGSWAFRYDIRGDEDDEAGYRFENEHFEVGEYVSVREADATHTYRVISVESV